MASKGSLRLMNEQIKDICEKMAAHEETAQAAFNSQHKNAYMLSLTPYYRGDAADAFKRYLEDGQINLLNGFLDLSSEMARVARFALDKFTQYESEISGAVSENALDYIEDELKEKEHVFNSAADELEQTANLARKYVTVKDLELQAVSEGYFVTRKAVSKVGAELHECDDIVLAEADRLYEKIFAMKTQVEMMIGFCYSNGILDVDKAAEIGLQSWHAVNNSGVSSLLFISDAFFNEIKPPEGLSEVERLAFERSIAASKAEACKRAESEIARLAANLDRVDLLSVKERLSIIRFISEKYRGLDITDVPGDERNLLVRSYELNNQGNTRVIDHFLRDVASDGNHDEDILNIKYLAYASPDPYHSVFFKYLPEITLSTHQGTTAPSCIAGYMSINLANRGMTDYSGGYATFFHEIGHGIDFAMSQENKGVLYYTTTIGGISLIKKHKGLVCAALATGGAAFRSIIRPEIGYSLKPYVLADVENGIRREIMVAAGVEPPLSESDQVKVDTIYESLVKGGEPLADVELNSIRTGVQMRFGRYDDDNDIGYRDNGNGIIYGHQHSGASDVYSGVTGYNISGRHTHYGVGPAVELLNFLPNAEEYGGFLTTLSDTLPETLSNVSKTLSAASPVMRIILPDKEGYEELIASLPDKEKYEEFLAFVSEVDYWDIFDPSLEFFADSFSAGLTQYSGPLESLENHLPGATAAFQEIMENAVQ